jgi:holo-[acyl-carrier protein] synthase
MMVRGIGVDIIEIDRIRKSIERTGAQFLEKIYTPSELEYCNAKAYRYQHFAARFAAKEALSKALATGWAGEFRWKHVEITNDPSGKPGITLHGSMREHLGTARIHLSMSHSESYVVAVVVIEDGAS